MKEREPRRSMLAALPFEHFGPTARTVSLISSIGRHLHAGAECCCSRYVIDKHCEVYDFAHLLCMRMVSRSPFLIWKTK